MDCIKEIRIQGLRTVIDVRLALSPFTVLTGENGSGKSTIIEACEVLRQAALPGFLSNFVAIHGGLDAFKSHGCEHVTIGARIDGQGDPLEYWLRIEDIYGLAITGEGLRAFPQDGTPYDVFTRTIRSGTFLDEGACRTEVVNVAGSQLLLTGFGLRVPHGAITRMINALQRIEVQIPFAVMPTWIERTVGQHQPSMRYSAQRLPKDSLTRSGTNLANVFASLRKKASWQTTLEYVRLGLGDDIDDIEVRPTANDTMEIWFKYRSFDQLVPARGLSDGTLGYLAFIALFRTSGSRSLLAFDEPENQLHPLMVTRVAQFLESMSAEYTILVATHSDRFLDALTDPAASVVLCKLGPERQTIIVRPDAKGLAQWLQTFRGIGELRSAGYESSVMTEESTPRPKDG